jgi:hypothetical protein
MLTPNDTREIATGFGIYDHEWRAYLPTLGEPFLFGDFLAYFDGTVAYLCTYALGDTGRVLSSAEVKALLAGRDELAGARAIVIWGRFEAPPTISLGGEEPLECVMQLDYDDDLVDSVVDLDQFFSPDRTRMPRAYRVACKSPLKVTTHRIEQLGPEHLAVMDFWAASHAVLPIHASFARGVTEYVREPSMYVTEARLEGRLLGFAVISISAPDHAVFLQNFNHRASGLPVGDAIYASMFHFATERGVRHLHLGYSATPGLLRFKRKWGPLVDQPPFREAGFTNEVELANAIQEHRVDWRNRRQIVV